MISIAVDCLNGAILEADIDAIYISMRLEIFTWPLNLIHSCYDSGFIQEEICMHIMLVFSLQQL